MMQPTTETIKTGTWFNWSSFTLFYVFVLGGVTGTIYAIAAGEMTPNGPLITIYLSVMGALFAAALGWLGSRVTDALVDRRAQRRRANVLILRIRRLRRAVGSLRGLLSSNFLRDMAAGNPEGPVGFLFGAYDIVQLASKEPPKFEDLIDNDEELEVMDAASRAFEFCSYRFTLPERIKPDSDDGVARKYFHQVLTVPGTVEAVDRALRDLSVAEQHLVARRAR